MTDIEKKEKLQSLLEKNSGEEEDYYVCLDEIGDLIINYREYMTTKPIDVEIEIKRLEEGEYELCAALLTMILREEHFCKGSFEMRFKKGQVTTVLKQMIKLI